MIGSFFVGLSGMQAYSAGLRQISNNITNLNSTGFKATDLQFTDLYGQGQGDAESVAYGIGMGESRINFEQGELRQSERALDLAIDGDGFLVLLNEADQYFARTGSFEIDNDGYIVLAGTDYRLTYLDESGTPTPITIDPVRTNPPSATTRIAFADNLSAAADDYSLSGIQVFNDLGDDTEWQVGFSRIVDQPGSWTVTVTNQAGTEIASETLEFGTGAIPVNGSIISVTDPDHNVTVELDFSENVTSFSSGNVSTLRTADIDGFGLGEITSVVVNENGILEVGYSNEQSVEIGAVTLASIRDLQSLRQESGGLFSATTMNGVDYLTSENLRVGRVLSNRVEASNVDLSGEFGELVLIQRGYQASSQVLSVSNDMIQQLFGLRGQ